MRQHACRPSLFGTWVRSLFRCFGPRRKPGKHATPGESRRGTEKTNGSPEPKTTGADSAGSDSHCVSTMICSSNHCPCMRNWYVYSIYDSYTWIFETAQIIAFSGKNTVTASFSKDGVFCCDEAHAGRKQKETASLSVQTASLGVQTASFPVHGFCTTHKTAFFLIAALKNASGKNLCRLKIQVLHD